MLTALIVLTRPWQCKPEVASIPGWSSRLRILTVLDRPIEGSTRVEVSIDEYRFRSASARRYVIGQHAVSFVSRLYQIKILQRLCG
jgi:hypothetical protein